MSILIKGMEMPKNCEECNLESFCDLWVEAKRLCGETFTDAKSRIKATIRHPDCPLVEVKPHGRLIEVDALNEMINQSYPMTDRVDVHNGYAIVQEMMKQIPTIIEADDSRKQGKWVLKTFDDGYGEYQLYECNLCGAVTAQRKSKNYCHNCGAKMESEEEEC